MFWIIWFILSVWLRVLIIFWIKIKLWKSLDIKTGINPCSNYLINYILFILITMYQWTILIIYCMIYGFTINNEPLFCYTALKKAPWGSKARRNKISVEPKLRPRLLPSYHYTNNSAWGAILGTVHGHSSHFLSQYIYIYIYIFIL